MHRRTKKVGSAGRYGVRIGRKAREELQKIEKKQGKNRCPSCGGIPNRKSSGIWECKSCGLKFAGGAYLTITERITPAAETATITGIIEAESETEVEEEIEKKKPEEDQIQPE